MHNQEAFLLYTMLNTQNSQLPCFITSISLKPFPHLAHSICHLSLLTAPTLHSPSLLCFLCSLPSFAILSYFVLFFKVFLLSFFFPFPTASISTCPLQPYSHPDIHLLSPLSLLFLSPPLSTSLQCESSTCDTLLPVSSHLNEMCGLAISDSSRQEVRANLSPTSTPHQLLLFVFITQICCPWSHHNALTSQLKQTKQNKFY